MNRDGPNQNTQVAESADQTQLNLTKTRLQQSASMAKQADSQQAMLDSQRQQIEEANKPALEKAMDQVLQQAFMREQENEQKEAEAIAFFFDKHIKRQQDKKLESALAEIRMRERMQEIAEPLIGLNYKTKSDELLNDEDEELTDEKEQEEIRIADENIKHYQRARDNGHIEYVNKARKAMKFYQGDQWNTQDLQYLNEVGRPALTINRILGIVNSIISLKLKESTSFFAQAISLEDLERAEILSKIFLFICRQTKYATKENKAFKDCILTGRGYIEARISFDKNIEGDVSIKRLNPEEVLLDPDSSDNDPKDWHQVITTKWMSLNDITLQYGEKKAKRVEELAVDQHNGHDDIFVFSDNSADTFGDMTQSWTYAYQELDPKENREIKCVRIISRQFKKYRMIPHFLDPLTKDCKPVPTNWDIIKIKEFATKNSLYLMNKKAEAIRWITTAGHVVLHDSWSPYRTFTVIPMFCYSANTSNIFGVIDNLISPQEQLNKIESQETHVINSTANSGWLIEEDSLTNMNADELAYHGSKTGIVVEYKKNTRNVPIKIQPNNIPSGLANASERSSQNLTSVSGIDGAFMGIGKITSTSDASLERKFNQTRDSYSILNEQIKTFREHFGIKLLELVQDFYNDNRVFCISEPENSTRGYEQVVINQPHPQESSVINDISVGEYCISVKNTPVATSIDNMLFSQIMLMKEAGIAIPSYRAILASDLINKAEIAQEVQKLEGLAPPTPEQQQIQEMQTQAQIKEMQLNLEKMQAEIQKLVSASVLDQAKAQSETAKPDMETIRNQTALVEANINKDLRTELSEVAARTSIETTSLKTQAEIEKENIRSDSSSKLGNQKSLNDITSRYLLSGLEQQNKNLDSINKIRESYEQEKAKSKFNPTQSQPRKS